MNNCLRRPCPECGSTERAVKFDKFGIATYDMYVYCPECHIGLGYESGLSAWERKDLEKTAEKLGHTIINRWKNL